MFTLLRMCASTGLRILGRAHLIHSYMLLWAFFFHLTGSDVPWTV
jgi:hypothetical protein